MFRSVNSLISSYQTRDYGWLICLIGLALVIPVSHAGTAIMSGAILLFALTTGAWKSAGKSIVTNPIAVLFLVLFFWIVLSFTYTSADTHLAMSDFKKYSRFAIVPLLLVLFSNEKIQKIDFSADDFDELEPLASQQ